MSVSFEDIVKGAIEAVKFGAPKARAFFNIRKEIKDELTLNIKLLDKIISNKALDDQGFILKLASLQFDMLEKYIKLTNIGKYWICRSRVSEKRAQRFKAPFVFNKNLEEITRANFISMEELFRNDVIPSKDVRIRLINIKKRLLVCKDMLAV
ncbi:hypothetical protein N8017_04720 [Crocinitomicaceae bacterium]|nr:hypothetical protein [Crocinitomicaceae bacterium]